MTSVPRRAASGSMPIVGSLATSQASMAMCTVPCHAALPPPHASLGAPHHCSQLVQARQRILQKKHRLVFVFRIDFDVISKIIFSCGVVECCRRRRVQKVGRRFAHGAATAIARQRNAGWLEP